MYFAGFPGSPGAPAYSKRVNRMETNYFEHYSASLQRTMPVKVYGHAGKPILYIPCQNGRPWDFENFGMAGALSAWIDGGRCRVFSVDTVDAETWSAQSGNPYLRIRFYERWIEYLTRELVPWIRSWSGWEGGVMVFGCSMGASHALNLYLRFPDIFDRCLALSGIYHASFCFGSYMDELVYRNSPADYMAQFPVDHPFMELYRQNRAVVCTGQGAWEEPWSTRYVDRLFRERGIPIWVDYWGYDVSHDWPWWFREADYFFPYLLD